MQISHEKDVDLKDDLTYSQEYYILNREKILEQKREERELAKFGDFSAKLVKRPQKGFMWGYGTKSSKFFRDGELPTIREVIRFLEVY